MQRMADVVVIAEYEEEMVEMAYHEEEMSSGLECRICLQTTHSRCPLSLKTRFEVADQTTVMTLQQLMVLICIVRIDGNDEERMPKNLCEDCKDGLVSAYRLRLTAQSSVLLLRQNLANVDEDTTAPSVIVMDSAESDPLGGGDSSLVEIIATSDIDDGSRISGRRKSNKLKRLDGPDPCLSHLCSDCGKTFKTITLLKTHLRTHTGEKPFSCDQCPSRFASRRNYLDHLPRHTGIRNFVCRECGKRFATKWTLQKHERVHTGVRPYGCPHCVKRFMTSDHLTRHVRIHTGEKPYKCTYCDRAYSQSGELVQHMRSHVGECTYQCDQCPEAFKLHGELRSHLEEHFRAAKELQG